MRHGDALEEIVEINKQKYRQSVFERPPNYAGPYFDFRESIGIDFTMHS